MHPTQQALEALKKIDRAAIDDPTVDSTSLVFKTIRACMKQLEDDSLTALSSAAPAAGEVAPIPAGWRLIALPIEWTPGANVFKDWCGNWFGPDSDDDYLMKAVHALVSTVSVPAAPSATLLNGLTDAETRATASVAGLSAPSATSAEPTVMDEKAERAAFEADYRKRYGHSEDFRSVCESEWRGWKARAIQPEAETSAEKALQFLLKQQWSCDKSFDGAAVWHVEFVSPYGEHESEDDAAEALRLAAQADAPVAQRVTPEHWQALIDGAHTAGIARGRRQAREERLGLSDAPVAEPVRWIRTLENGSEVVYQSKPRDSQLKAWAEWGDKVFAVYTEPPAPEDGKDAALRLKGVDEYGPLLEWSKHWTEFPAGTEFVVKEPAR